MTQYRFYLPDIVRCPECGHDLFWEQTPNVTHGANIGMRLRHPDVTCSRMGKVFFAPELQVDLTEWK